MELDYFDDPEFQKLTIEYLDYLEESLAELKSNISQEKYDDIRQYGHNLTGSGGGYGFEDLTKLGRQINLAAKAKDKVGLEQLTGELEMLITDKQSKFSA